MVFECWYSDGLVRLLAEKRQSIDRALVSGLGQCVTYVLGAYLFDPFSYGVCSGVTRAEEMLKMRLKDNKQDEQMWRKTNKMHDFYA